MDSQALVKRLEGDGIENLWVIYHDYSGRSCAKTIPKENFSGVVERGVVFAALLPLQKNERFYPGRSPSR